jgi:hypothetical protein
MSNQQTFRELIEAIQERTRKPGAPPVPVRELAKRCKINRPYFYALMNGTYTANLWTEERLAAGLGVPLKTVQAALQASREQSKVLS